jgi:hypothetical protein
MLEEDQELDQLTLQQYSDKYKKPLSDQALEAITQLAKASEDNKRKKKLKKKEEEIGGS